MILRAEPQLFVSDLARSIDFYTSRLGFRLAFSYGEPPFYAQVVRGGAYVNLRHAERPILDPSLRDREGDVLAATMVVDDIATLFEEVSAAGVDFHQPLRNEPWGAGTFIVADPCGNLIAFAGD